jgi:hypothetical protein
MHHAESMEWRGNLNDVVPWLLVASCCSMNGSAIGLVSCITARASRYATESFLPASIALQVPMQAASAQGIVTHGVVDVATLCVTTVREGGGVDTWVDTSRAKAPSGKRR